MSSERHRLLSWSCAKPDLGAPGLRSQCSSGAATAIGFGAVEAWNERRPTGAPEGGSHRGSSAPKFDLAPVAISSVHPSPVVAAWTPRASSFRVAPLSKHLSGRRKRVTNSGVACPSRTSLWRVVISLYFAARLFPSADVRRRPPPVGASSSDQGSTAAVYMEASLLWPHRMLLRDPGVALVGPAHLSDRWHATSWGDLGSFSGRARDPSCPALACFRRAFSHRLVVEAPSFAGFKVLRATGVGSGYVSFLGNV